jgi:hypothetical protein
MIAPCQKLADGPFHALQSSVESASSLASTGIRKLDFTPINANEP